MATCQGCGAKVFWKANVKTGRAAPVNPEPDPNGNVIMVGNKYQVLTKQELAQRSIFDMGEPEQLRYTLHFANCKNADHFRRCKKCHKEPCTCAAP